jgi:trimeric autotransporter adhesin
MATFTISTAAGFNMEALQLFDLFEKTSETRAATQYRTSFDADNFTAFIGTGLTYGGAFPNTTLTGGTITSILDKAAAATVFNLTGLSISAVNLYTHYVSADTQAALAEMLSGNDTVTGNAGDDDLFGFGGSDKLVGGLGADYMVGGSGDDVYVVDNAGDIVVENKLDGVDTVESGIAYVLDSAVENLTLTGTALAGTGNIENNAILGNAQNNTLNGLSGADKLTGAGGNDLLDGGAGSDELLGDAGNDTLLGGGENDLMFGGTGNDILDGGKGEDDMDGGAGNDVYIVDDQDFIVDSAGIDRVESSYFEHTLADTIENLTLLAGAYNGFGNALINVMQGNDEDNEIKGAGGNDTIYGGFGADHLFGDEGRDTLFGDDGADALYGGAENDTLWGGDGGDLLLGQEGIDTLRGGLGDDAYYIETAGDLVVENAAEGVDSVLTDFTYTLAANVENLELNQVAGAISGTGNALDNRIRGNTSANIIDGKAGADIMRGGLGADSYVVDDLGDRVFEVFSVTDIDQVTSSVDFRLTAHIENLTLSGTAIKATGNALANALNGNASANVIDGKQGADTMTGFNGNDTYYVDDFGDLVLENLGLNTGIDTVFSFVTYTLEANVENLTIAGAGTTAGNGNGLNNTIIGNANANSIEGKLGDDILEGGKGLDTLFGGDGLDDFRYTHLAADKDNIFDFIAGQDDIVVSAAAFGGGLAAGALAANRLVANAAPVAGLGAGIGQFLYDTDDGRLIWDQNGTTAGGQFHIATLNFGLGLIPPLTSADFLVIA